MQGPIYTESLSQGQKDKFFHQHRWSLPVAAVVLTNMFYVFSVKALIPEASIANLKFIESIHSASYLFFSILPFSESYFARVQLAYPGPAPAMLVVHSHAFILLTSALLLLFLLIKIRSFTQYIVEAKELARKDLSWSHYFNAVRMTIMVLVCLANVVVSMTFQSVSQPERILDGALLPAVFTPLLVHYSMCAVLLFCLSRKNRRPVAE